VVAIVQRLERWPATVHLLITLVALAAITLIDSVAPSELSFSIFYFVPVVWATWFTGRGTSLFIAVFASVAWSGADLAAASGAVNPFFTIWNGVMRLALFLLLWATLWELREISEYRQKLALSDPLTGVANLRVLGVEIEREIERLRRYGLPFTLAYLDLDAFKSVNDNLGHRAGDEILRSVAVFLAEHARDVDTVARIGGDEFAVLMPQSDRRAASPALDRISSGLREIIKSTAPTVESAGATIGATVFLHAPWSVDQAVTLSDELMYEGKRAGGGTVTMREYNGE
jgi:diguanylate cyclase (GGDEF)-like protein